MNIVYAQQAFIPNDGFVPLPIHWFGDLFMFVYYTLSAILLVNLLIAMMGSKFNDLMEDSSLSDKRIDGEWWYEMGKLLIYYERFPFLPTPFNIIQIIVVIIIYPMRYFSASWDGFIWNFFPSWSSRGRIKWQLYWEEHKDDGFFTHKDKKLVRKVEKNLRTEENEIWKICHEAEIDKNIGKEDYESDEEKIFLKSSLMNLCCICIEGAEARYDTVSLDDPDDIPYTEM